MSRAIGNEIFKTIVEMANEMEHGELEKIHNEMVAFITLEVKKMKKKFREAFDETPLYNNITYSVPFSKHPSVRTEAFSEVFEKLVGKCMAKVERNIHNTEIELEWDCSLEEEGWVVSVEWTLDVSNPF